MILSFVTHYVMGPGSRDACSRHSHKAFLDIQCRRGDECKEDTGSKPYLRWTVGSSLSASPFSLLEKGIVKVESWYSCVRINEDNLGIHPA